MPNIATGQRLPYPKCYMILLDYPRRQSRKSINKTFNKGIQNARHDYFANPTEAKYQEAIKNFKATVTTKTNGVVFDDTFASL